MYGPRQITILLNKLCVCVYVNMGVACISVCNGVLYICTLNIDTLN